MNNMEYYRQLRLQEITIDELIEQTTLDELFLFYIYLRDRQEALEIKITTYDTTSDHFASSHDYNVSTQLSNYIYAVSNHIKETLEDHYG